MTGHHGLRTARALVAALGLMAVAAGCLSVAEDATDVDRARLDALVSDPWLAPEAAELAMPQRASDGMYMPGTATATRDSLGHPADVLLAELTAAEAVGWEPVFARCMDAHSERARNEAAGRRSTRSLVVLLVRRLADDSYAEAVVDVEVISADWRKPVDRTVVTIDAAVAHHQQVSQRDRPRVDARTLTCLRSPRDMEGAVRGPIGDPILENRQEAPPEVEQ